MGLAGSGGPLRNGSLLFCGEIVWAGPKTSLLWFIGRGGRVNFASWGVATGPGPNKSSCLLLAGS